MKRNTTLKSAMLLTAAAVLALAGCSDGSGPGGGGDDPGAETGMIWTAVDTAHNGSFYTNAINGVAYGNGKFVAVGNSGRIAYSTDGITWTGVSNSTFGSSAIYGVAHGGTGAEAKFVAVGSDGKMATSGDGTSWTAIPTGSGGFSGNTIFGVAYGGGTWVAVGHNGKIAYLNTYWSGVGTNDFGTRTIYGVAYGNGKFVAVGSATGSVSMTGTSGDGTSWTAAVSSIFGIAEIRGVACGGGKFVVVGGGGQGKIATSGDGITWTAVDPANNGGFGTNFITGVAYGGTGAEAKFVAVGNSNKIAYSTDGTSWTAADTTNSGFPSVGSGIRGVAYGNGTWVAVGENGKIAYCAD